ncbi:unnamed protein product [Fusarium graminearum]|uniref:Chromosome 4, complete genome n=1 Tax=Gibberella zeae (strain ATCC MYA-4620 / CBS 123657 / FGSC 9075 / NRRL 31084 / PH-1) TaxID=229533 RepID=I1S815_GIBZE|nr:hypothetical protein FGSG_12990 [Fusarium graminearum PH-1]ESU12941.1 hypothetical protein FGSG_12990 [Fusarium graminearum PH-1]CEF84716.1 unnamed protein product [Fusarium graminearum]CZS72521.1 unnamed protein product [Fusarium graminearum]|eukprot:XP_011326448.1 hypothetical protein FGSG_12990 [Fusarium graminearum PH-1]
MITSNSPTIQPIPSSPQCCPLSLTSRFTAVVPSRTFFETRLEREKMNLVPTMPSSASNKQRCSFSQSLRHNAPFDTPTPPNRGTVLYMLATPSRLPSSCASQAKTKIRVKDMQRLPKQESKFLRKTMSDSYSM